MWYVIKIIAALPGLTVGLCSLTLWVVAFVLDCYWLVIPCILLFWGALICSSVYESTVDTLYDMWIIISGKTKEKEK